mgnify:FL=1
MILKLIPNTHPMLHERVCPCNKCAKSTDRHEVAKILIENMHHYEGIGLSANQIGLYVRAFAMVRDLENNEVIVCFNPKIVKKYNECVEFEEGCLSYPDEYISVKRPDRIVVKYEDEDKKVHKIKLSGMAARVFQHEFDHLEGIDFTQRQ